MSLHLDYADENFREAWIASTNDPAAIKALVIGGRALVRSGRELERLCEQVQQLQREVEQLRPSELEGSGGSLPLKEVRDIQIVATAQCERCAGGGVIYDPDEFGWEGLLAGEPATLDDRVTARVRERELDNPPSEEGQCPDCEGSGRHSVTLTVAEYESLRRQGTTPLIEPPSLTDLVQNPRRVVELSNRELLEMGARDPRKLLVRSLRHAYREVRREYAARLRAAQAQRESGERTAPQAPERREIEGLLAEGKRIETALALLHREQARDAATPGMTAILVPELEATMAPTTRATQAMSDRAFTTRSDAAASVSILVIDTRWRAAAAPHLQSAITELERAVAAMPASLERLLLNRALRTCALSLRACTRISDRRAFSESSSRTAGRRGVRP